MGGDQLYADGLWESDRAPSVRRWAQLDRDRQAQQQVGPKIRGELERFYEDLYVRYWGFDEMALAMASIPTVMMWDDHDIFDGWGSYSAEAQAWPVYQAVFATARRYFELMQIRSSANRSLLAPEDGHYTFGLRLRDSLLLVLDNRSQRTQERIMDGAHWRTVKAWLDARVAEQDQLPARNFFLGSAVPVLYRDFPVAELAMDATEWLRPEDKRGDLEDDLRDHWRHRSHEGERLRLLHNLFDFGHGMRAASGGASMRNLILSGDVHVGALGVLRDRARGVEFHQVIASGIVHPPPGGASRW